MLGRPTYSVANRKLLREVVLDTQGKSDRTPAYFACSMIVVSFNKFTKALVISLNPKFVCLSHDVW